MDSHQILVRSRLKKGVAAQVFGQAVNIFIQVAGVPLFLHFWGVELYGEWLILFAIPAYLSMSDLGFTGVCIREMAMLVAKNEHDKALSLFRSTVFFVMLLSFIVLLLIAYIAFILPIADWLNFSELSNESSAIVIILLAAQVFINFQTSMIYGGFYCEGNYGLGQFILSSVRLLEFLCIAGTLIAGFGPIEVATAYTLGSFIGTLTMLKLLRKIAPWLTFGIRGTNKNIIRRLISPSMAATAFPIGNALNLQGMRIVVGMAIGPAAVTIFSTLRTLARVGLMFLRAIENLVQPEIGIAYGNEDFKFMRKIHRNSCQVSFWGSLAVMCCLVFFGKWVLFYWTRGQIEMDMHLFIMLLFATLINALWFMSLMIPYSTNRHNKVAKAYILANIITVGIAIGACRMFGLYGVAGTLILVEIVMALYVIPNSLNMVDDQWLNFFRALALPPFFLFEAIRKRNNKIQK